MSEVPLYTRYILARQPGKLAALFKASRDEKIATFLGRDFEGDEAARVAARKNGYSLVSKQHHLSPSSLLLSSLELSDTEVYQP